MTSAPGTEPGAAAPAGAPPRVVAVVVTFDRRELVLEALAALAAQQRPAELVLVIDNASTDGTDQAVRDRFPDVQLERLESNLGGAGGFAHGIDLALRHGADLVWLLDDDTVAHPDTLRRLLAAREAYPGPRPVLLASRAVWTDGRAHPMNLPRRRPFAGPAQRRRAAAIGAVPIRSASFVSVLVDAEQCRRRGLPVADFFIWNDDFEFTTRLLRGAVGLLCPDSVVTHKTRAFGSIDADPGERFFYEVRNKIWTMRFSPGLAPHERLLYGGATLRRWARALRRSGNRPVLWSALRRGVAAGLRARPRSNAEVLPH